MFEINVTPELVETLTKSAPVGPYDTPERQKYATRIAKFFELPLREAILAGDITGGIYRKWPLPPGANPELPLDLIAPGTERDFVAWTMPNAGYVAQRSVEADYVTLHTYRIANAIDWDIKFSRDANWNIVARAFEVYEAGLIKKVNDDGWHTILASMLDRNILVNDSTAAAGQFTKRLVSVLKTQMRRGGGGNSGSMNRYKLTHLYMSPEGVEDIRDWGVDQLDDVSRREVYVMPDGSEMRIFGVVLRDLDELGVGQEYQTYLTSILGGSLASTDVELVVGLDQSKGSFYMPVREDFFIQEDTNLHRSQRQGYYGWGELGFTAVDNRSVIGGSF